MALLRVACAAQWFCWGDKFFICEHTLKACQVSMTIYHITTCIGICISISPTFTVEFNVWVGGGGHTRGQEYTPSSQFMQEPQLTIFSQGSAIQCRKYERLEREREIEREREMGFNVHLTQTRSFRD